LKKKLILTGMMGVGKSTIGKKLAKKLKFKFVDIDEIIEKQEKKTIKEIFKIKGENYFRKIEEKTTLKELKKINLVIALGGGAFINETIRKEVKESSLSFWLDIDVDLLIPRLKNISKRPLLNQENIEQSIKKIYSQRKKIYNESDHKINCSSLKIEAIVNQIINLYEDSRNQI
jgi:shikimate kinase